jgi:hypothetical protein
MLINAPQYYLFINKFMIASFFYLTMGRVVMATSCPIATTGIWVSFSTRRVVVGWTTWFFGSRYLAWVKHPRVDIRSPQHIY